MTTNKKRRAIALAAAMATIVTMAAMAPSQASQTVQDRGTRIAPPAGATVVAWEAGGGASTQRSGR
jgi:hypothetical protein